MCAPLDFGTQFSTAYARHMLGKAESPWRTLRDRAFAMMHTMSAPSTTWSCAISKIAFLENRIFSRAVGRVGGVPLTLRTGVVPDASAFIVFGFDAFSKIPDNQRNKLNLKSFRGVFVGYPLKSLGYHNNSPTTRLITTSVHVVFHEDVRGFRSAPTPPPPLLYAAEAAPQPTCLHSPDFPPRMIMLAPASP
jgi:hypothetical protein